MPLPDPDAPEPVDPPPIPGKLVPTEEEIDMALEILSSRPGTPPAG